MKIIVPMLLNGFPTDTPSEQDTFCKLVDSQTKEEISFHSFRNFLELSPKKNFGVLVLWNDFRDASDMSLVVINNETGNLDALCPIHSIPAQVRWLNDETVQLNAYVRPSVISQQNKSDYDIAVMTTLNLTKFGTSFKVSFIKN